MSQIVSEILYRARIFSLNLSFKIKQKFGWVPKPSRPCKVFILTALDKATGLTVYVEVIPPENREYIVRLWPLSEGSDFLNNRDGVYSINEDNQHIVKDFISKPLDFTKYSYWLNDDTVPQSEISYYENLTNCNELFILEAFEKNGESLVYTEVIPAKNRETVIRSLPLPENLHPNAALDGVYSINEGNQDIVQPFVSKPLDFTKYSYFVSDRLTEKVTSTCL